MDLLTSPVFLIAVGVPLALAIVFIFIARLQADRAEGKPVRPITNLLLAVGVAVALVLARIVLKLALRH